MWAFLKRQVTFVVTVSLCVPGGVCTYPACLNHGEVNDLPGQDDKIQHWLRKKYTIEKDLLPQAYCDLNIYHVIN